MSAKTLTSKELRKLSHAAAGLCTATNQHVFGSKVHSLIRSVCAVEHAVYGSFDLKAHSGVNLYSNREIERLAENTTSIYLHYVKTYPEIWSGVLSVKHQGKVVRARELTEYSLVKATGYYEEYAKPTFSEYQIVHYLRDSGRLVIIICNRNGREFSDKEKAVVEFLAPHLQSAYENCIAFEANEQRLSRAEAMQQAIPQQLIWLNRDLVVQEITPRIPQLIKEFFDQEMRFNQLPKKLMDWLRAPRASHTAEPLRPLFLRRAEASLKIRFYPEQLPGLNLLVFHRQRLTPTLEDIQPLGLSRRESEVLLWLAQGKTNTEISRILYINCRTADWHVQSILRKLGLENRVAATQLVADLLQS